MVLLKGNSCQHCMSIAIESEEENCTVVVLLWISRVFSGYKTMSLSSPTGWLPIGQSSVVLAEEQLADWKRENVVFLRLR